MNSSEKTLVILTPGFAWDEADTTCLPMQQSFVRALKEKFPNLNIVVFAFQYPYENKVYDWAGNIVFSFDGRNRGGLFKLYLRRRILAALNKIHAAYDVCGILSFWYGECALVGKRFSGQHGVKHYCWMWGQDAKKENKYPRKLRLNENDLIAFSDFLQAEFEKNHQVRPVHVIPPGIDRKEFNFQEVKKDLDIVAAGSLIPLKQYDVLIKIVAKVKMAFPLVKAILIGGGPEKNNLQTLIEKNGLQSNIVLAGELPHPDVLLHMQRGRVFLHPSSFEGFGIVCIEALCAGAKVISFVKPMNNVIENWDFATNAEEMAEKTIKILQHPSQENKSIVPYTIEQCVEKMAGLFSI